MHGLASSHATIATLLCGLKGGRTLRPIIFAEAVFMQNYSKTTCCADF